MVKTLFSLMYVFSLIFSLGQGERIPFHSIHQAEQNSIVYLPTISNGNPSTPAPMPTNTTIPPIVSTTTTALVNMPYFPVNESADSYSDQAAIFWLGQVNSNTSYGDIHLAYTNTEVTVYISVFDRLLWYNKTPSVSDMTQWDGTTLYLNTSGVSNNSLGRSAYRFDGQINWFEARSNYQASYQVVGNNWSAAAINFSTNSGYRGVGMFNSGINSRGWAITYHIPFSSLNLSSRPVDGATWGIALALHNRNSLAGPPQPDETWPDKVDLTKPSTWALLHFGIPTFTPPAVAEAGKVTIRNGLNGITVPDGGVGGTVANLCPGDETYIWNQWGNANYAGETGVNIQNQSNIDDFPCFSKYYLTFPLNSLPASRKILKATLVLHQWGGSGDVIGGHPPQPSFIQIETLLHDFTPSTLTWNNAPQAYENVSTAWANPEADYTASTIPWPKYERDWDVSRAVASAYAAGQPLRLALYDGATEYNSGLFFTTSETENWNANGRPTLIISWGN